VNGMWDAIGNRIWQSLQPWLESKWVEVKPKVLEFIKDQFDEWIPVIMKTIVVGVAQSAGQLVVNAEDKVTDIVPGPVDDAIIDPIVQNGMDWLNKILGR
jgi:hypothetical protein